jgi:hypothetical protein
MHRQPGKFALIFEAAAKKRRSRLSMGWQREKYRPTGWPVPSVDFGLAAGSL